ncbi:MAG: threonylcarbamoyl-AMP synthase [Alphaproteobacteria bacterium]|nr:threonylcarbamoyl-AMP synthase [Alphaproteobacteria bacterium]
MISAADADGIQQGASLLRQGRLVAFPTETVYGLGADATDDKAVAAIYAAKDRPDFNPLIVHFTDMDAAAEAVVFDDRAKRVAHAFWPGALTLVLPRTKTCPISLLTSAGLNTLAVRVPSQPVAQALFRAAGLPVAAPSANRSFSVSPTTAQHVIEDLSGRIDLILDGGPCPVGLESTVIDLSTPIPTLLRPGGIATEEIEAVTGPLAAAGEGAPKSPGMLSRHYAPCRPVRLNATAPRDGEAYLAFGPGFANATMNLSERGNLNEAAAAFFAMLRALDRNDFSGIAVAPIPERGLGRAINDRLRRAATQ